MTAKFDKFKDVTEATYPISLKTLALVIEALADHRIGSNDEDDWTNEDVAHAFDALESELVNQGIKIKHYGISASIVTEQPSQPDHSQPSQP